MSMRLLYGIQDALRTFLAGTHDFPGAYFISRREGKLLNDIEAGQVRDGLSCFIYPPVPVSINPNLPGPQFDKLQIRITWWEDYDLNHGSSFHSDEAAMMTMRRLHHRDLGIDGLGFITAQPEEPMTWQLTNRGLDQWDCWFNSDVDVPWMK